MTAAGPGRRRSPQPPSNTFSAFIEHSKNPIFANVVKVHPIALEVWGSWVLWDVRSSPRTIAELDLDTRCLWIDALRHPAWRMDPTVSTVLRAVAASPWASFRVGLRTDRRSVRLLSPRVPVAALAGQLQVLPVEGLPWPLGRPKRWTIDVLDAPWDVSWFHATRAGTLPAIERYGLIPGGYGQGEGWTHLNLHLQPFVYLTHSLPYARRIAQTLRHRYREPALLLRVDPAFLRDTRRLGADEDAFRRSDDGFVTPDPALPPWLASASSHVQSLGYKGSIPWNKLSIVR